MHKRMWTMLALAIAGAPVRAQMPTIHVQEGLVSGTSEGGITRFLGIPYAAPPVGRLRWSAPRPAGSWSGVRRATGFAPACAQTAAWIAERKSEDCLYLNIWAPAQPHPGRLPVMVWIYGGGFYGGSGAQPLYDGTRLAKRGAVVVTINYRLGIFGFFAHPQLTAAEHVTGNQGLLDQVAALRWIRRNIAAVGGDPDRVTVMGESAGAESVAVLGASPLATGLFQRAIAESGNDGMPLTRAEAADFSAARAEAAGLALGRRLGRVSLAGLRRLPSGDLLREPWSPHAVTDGRVIREDLTSAYRKGHVHPVPLLLGWNSNEGVDLAPEILGTDRFTAATFRPLVETLLRRPVTPAFVAAYPARDDAQAKASLERAVTDWWGWRMWAWAGLHRAQGAAPAWLYYFVHWPADPGSPCGYGCKAGHGAEIRYVFDQLDQDKRTWTAADRTLADDMAAAWVDFARTGDPNGGGARGWRPFDGGENSVKRLGTREEIRARGALPRFDLLAPAPAGHASQ